MNEEGAESAEIVPGKSLEALLSFREEWERGPLFPPASWPQVFGHFHLCVLRDLCG